MPLRYDSQPAKSAWNVSQSGPLAAPPRSQPERCFGWQLSLESEAHRAGRLAGDADGHGLGARADLEAAAGLELVAGRLQFDPLGCEFCGLQYRFDAGDVGELFTPPVQQGPGSGSVN